MEVTFRHARESDLGRIVETYNSTIPSRLVTADLEPVTVDSRREWFRAHTPEKHPLLVVEGDGRYAGWISFGKFYGRPAYAGCAEVSIYLEETFRSKGLGDACMKKALDLAPSLQFHSLLGFIFGHNTPSIKLFEKYGFKRWGTLPGVADMNGELRDLVIMGRKV
jgi:L-amino acid N-acyltransferase YncA